MTQTQPRIECPGCGKSHKVPAQAIGRKVRCNVCQEVFIAKTPAEDPLEVQAPPPPKPETQRTCRHCKATVAPKAVICTACGLNLMTGQMTGASQTVTGEPMTSLKDIFTVPFKGDLLLNMLALSVAAGIWMFLAAIGSWFFGLLTLIMYMLYLGWLASKLLGTVEQFEQGNDVEEDRPMLSSVFYFISVALIAIGPFILLRINPGGVLPDVLVTPVLTIIAVVWAWVYAPMGLAQAGAYWDLNPVTAAKRIIDMPVGYGLVLAYSALCNFCLPYLILWIEDLFESLLGILAEPVSNGVATMISTFGLVSHCAIMGMLLRRHRETTEGA